MHQCVLPLKHFCEDTSNFHESSDIEQYIVQINKKKEKKESAERILEKIQILQQASAVWLNWLFKNKKKYEKKTAKWPV